VAGHGIKPARGGLDNDARPNTDRRPEETMTVRKFNDQGFDDYRRERKRMQAKLGPQASQLGYENQALRELEQVEAREVRDQQLTREVHEFFASATKQAAAIVDRVSRDAQQEAGQKVEQEMESFLIDSLARMNTLVMALLQQRRGSFAETQVVPSVGNIVGQSLDEFRWAGTADVADKHIGQDPFATGVDDVRREFRALVGGAAESTEVAVPIDQHLVAAMQDPAPATPAPAAGKPAPAPVIDALPPPPTPVTRTSAAPPAGIERRPAAPRTAPGAASHEAAAPASPGPDELERFKGALKARAAWQARLQALGLAG
jgi:hypothetical protein